jgi:von Willebrand factor A domain-containing protein 8
LCILGPKGVGKSRLLQLLALRLGYQCEYFPVFKDLTSRDLVQRRSTDSLGNTVWADSPLITAAKTGRMAVLDGIHRLSPDTLATLQRLIHDRCVIRGVQGHHCPPGGLPDALPVASGRSIFWTEPAW